MDCGLLGFQIIVKYSGWFYVSVVEVTVEEFISSLKEHIHSS